MRGFVVSTKVLYVVFMSSFQKPDEKPSQYLTRLNHCFSKLIDKGGLMSQNPDQEMVQQFESGCWDESLITQLQFHDYLDENNRGRILFNAIINSPHLRGRKRG